MHRQPIDLYAAPLEAITQSCLQDLRWLFGTTESVYIDAGNGHGAREAALSNVFSAGDKVLVLESGLFAPAWGELARANGIEVEILPGSHRHAVEPRALEERLRADRDQRIKATWWCRWTPPRASPMIFRHCGPQSRRRAFSTLHGRCYRLACHHAFRNGSLADRRGDRRRPEGADAAARPGLRRRWPEGQGGAQIRRPRVALLDWTFRDGEEKYMKYRGTAPEQPTFGLRASLQPSGPKGRRRSSAMRCSAKRRAAPSTMGKAGALEFNIVQPAHRSNAVTTIRARTFVPEALMNGRWPTWCETRHGSELSGPCPGSPIWATSTRPSLWACSVGRSGPGRAGGGQASGWC